MKKSNLIFPLLGIFSFVLVGCSTPTEDTPSGGDTDIEAKVITLSEHTLTLNVGENHTLSVTFHPENTTDKSLVWSTDHENVASVDQNGYVVALASGSAKITVTHGTLIDYCTVTVPGEEPPAPTLQGINLTYSVNGITVGDHIDMNHLSVVATYSDNSTREVKTEASYHYDGNSIADLSTFTFPEAGSHVLKATYQGKTSEVTLTVIGQDPGPGPEPLPTTKAIYLNSNGLYDKDGNVPFVYAWDEGGQGGTAYSLTKVTGQTIIYKAEINSVYDRVIFMAQSEGESLDWEKKVYQTGDLVIPTDKDMFTVKTVDATASTGEWSLFDSTHTYEPDEQPGPEPVINYKTIYLNSNGKLEADNASLYVHAWDENGGMDYPLVQVEGQTIIYSAEINEAYTSVVFQRKNADGTEEWNKTADLALEEGKDMFVVSGFADNTILGAWATFDPETTYVVDEGGETPEINYRTIYLNANGIFDADNAVMFIHAWDANGQYDYKLEPVEGQTIIYKAEVNEAYVSCCFVRQESGDEINWESKWNEIKDLSIPTDKDMFTVTSIEGNGAGEWGTFDTETIYVVDGGGEEIPPEVTYKTIYLNANNVFDADNAVMFIHAYKVGGDDDSFADVKFELVEGQTTVYSAQIEAKFNRCCFVRQKSGDTIDWAGKWNETTNLKIYERCNMYVTSTISEGYWGVYDEAVTYPVTPTSAEVTYTVALVDYYDDDNAKVYAWVWGGTAGDGEWKLLELSEDGMTGTFVAAGDITGMKIGRFSSDTTEPNFDNAWNKTQDLVVYAGQQFFDIAGKTS